MSGVINDHNILIFTRCSHYWRKYLRSWLIGVINDHNILILLGEDINNANIYDLDWLESLMNPISTILTY